MFKGSFSLFLILASIFKHNMNKKRDEFSFLFLPHFIFLFIHSFYLIFQFILIIPPLLFLLLPYSDFHNQLFLHTSVLIYTINKLLLLVKI